jgi:hypothetical protein
LKTFSFSSLFPPTPGLVFRAVDVVQVGPDGHTLQLHVHGVGTHGSMDDEQDTGLSVTLHVQLVLRQA